MNMSSHVCTLFYVYPCTGSGEIVICVEPEATGPAKFKKRPSNGHAKAGDDANKKKKA